MKIAPKHLLFCLALMVLVVWEPSQAWSQTPPVGGTVNVGPDECKADKPKGTPTAPEPFVCPACGVSETFIRGGFALMRFVSEAVSDSTRALTGVIMGVWILLQAGKLLLPLGPAEQATQIYNRIFGRLGLAIIALAIVQMPGLYQNYILEPILSSTIAGSEVLLKAASQTGDAGSANEGTLTLPPGLATGGSFSNSMVTAVKEQAFFAQKTILEGIEYGLRSLDIIPPSDKEAGNPIVDFFSWVANVVKTVVGGIMEMTSAILQARAAEAAYEIFLDAMQRVVAGIIVVALYGYVWLIYPLFMLDFVMKWAIISALAPLLVASIIFPSTRPTAVEAAKGLGHAALTMLFSAVVVGIMVAIMGDMAADQCLNEQKIDKEAFSDPKYLVHIVTAFVFVHMIKQTPKLASGFIQSNMDTDVLGGVVDTVKKLVWFAADAVSGGRASLVRKKLGIR